HVPQRAGGRQVMRQIPMPFSDGGLPMARFRKPRLALLRTRAGAPGESHQHARSGFTLVELLVVVTILLALTTFVVMTFNANSGSDRMRSAARTAQSAVLGANDRAKHAKERRGVRFLRDPQDLSLVTGFVYLQPMPRQR